MPSWPSFNPLGDASASPDLLFCHYAFASVLSDSLRGTSKDLRDPNAEFLIEDNHFPASHQTIVDKDVDGITRGPVQFDDRA